MKVVKKDMLTMIIVIIGILTAATIFLPTMAFPNDGTSFMGTEIVFGTEFANFGTWASGNILFSFLGVLAYLLPIAALLSAIYMKKGYLMSIIFFMISAVLLFLLPSYTSTTVTVLNTTTDIDVNWVTLFGLISAQVLAILGIIVSLFKSVK